MKPLILIFIASIIVLNLGAIMGVYLGEKENSKN
jgi:ABC-type phosphate transport system permease subunit